MTHDTAQAVTLRAALHYLARAEAKIRELTARIDAATNVVACSALIRQHIVIEPDRSVGYLDPLGLYVACTHYDAYLKEASEAAKARKHNP